jgi:hypothetical protein
MPENSESGLIKLRPVLVVDADASFVSSLQLDPAAKLVPPIFVERGHDAEGILSDSTKLLSGIFLDVEGANTERSVAIVRLSHQYRTGVPIFVLYGASEEPPFSGSQLQKLGIQKSFVKPVTYRQLLELVAPPGVRLDRLTVSPDADLGAIGAELADDSHFIPTRVESFLGGSTCHFNVFVCLPSGKYVKILNAGDEFPPDRLASYREKGLKYFYLRREEQAHFLMYCDQLTSALVQSHKIPMETKVSHTLNLGDETVSFLRTHGIDDAQLQQASGFVRNVRDLLGQYAPQKNKLLTAFLENAAAYEHGVGTTVIASLLVSEFNFDSPKTLQIVGLAALLHDIGLYQLPEKLRDEDESRMTEEELELYRTHPALGAKLLKDIKGLDPAVIQAVAQHHERINRKGFPSRVGVRSINRVAEFVGLSDEVIRRVKAAGGKPVANPLQDIQKNVLDGFSYPVAETFRIVFLESYLKKK